MESLVDDGGAVSKGLGGKRRAVIRRCSSSAGSRQPYKHRCHLSLSVACSRRHQHKYRNVEQPAANAMQPSSTAQIVELAIVNDRAGGL